MENEGSIPLKHSDFQNGLRVHPLTSRIATLVHAAFNALPNKCKPRTGHDGTREWVPLSGIVAVKGEGTAAEMITCVSVTTGAKCLPLSHIVRCNGLILHDSHAEILCIRAFNYWLLKECQVLISHDQYLSTDNRDNQVGSRRFQHVNLRDSDLTISPFIRRRRILDLKDNLNPADPWPPFEICPDVTFYMYCTCAPCGDASMELCMASQEDPTPWKTIDASPLLSDGSSRNSILPIPLETDQLDRIYDTQLLDGRAYFSILGVVRRKPSRADAERTHSKSCSDKLSLRQVTSLLSHGTNFLVAPTPNAYLKALILPDDELSRTGCDRAFGAGPTGRMRNLLPKLEDDQGVDSRHGGNDDHRFSDYSFRPFQVLSIPVAEVNENYSFRKPALHSDIDVEDQRSSSGSSSGRSNRNHNQTLSSSLMKPQGHRKSKTGNISAVWITPPSSICDHRHGHTAPSDIVRKEQKEDGGGNAESDITLNTPIVETLVNGVKQGAKVSKMTPRGASVLSRAKMWHLIRDIVGDLADNSGLRRGGGGDDGHFHRQVSREGIPSRTELDKEISDDVQDKYIKNNKNNNNNNDNTTGGKVKDELYRLLELVHSMSYEQFKRPHHIIDENKKKDRVSRQLDRRATALTDAKFVLRPWIPNRGDEDWNLDVLIV